VKEKFLFSDYIKERTFYLPVQITVEANRLARRLQRPIPAPNSRIVLLENRD
jgi:hypothetical protein